MDEEKRKNIVVVGEGFWGMKMISDIEGEKVRIKMIDKRKNNMLKKLIYKVEKKII